MAIKEVFTDSTFAKYIKAIRESPRELISNRKLLLTAALYATSGIPITWDQGSSSVVPSLPGFQKDFGITSATNPTQVSNFISFVYIGAGIGAALSFFLNDRIGRMWSYRLYMTIWIIGQIIATVSFGNLGALYTARIVSGLGIGALTVTGPVSIVEIAPTEIRGLLAVWFSVAMLLSLTVSVFIVYASFVHVAVGRMQYQLVFFSPTIVMAILIFLSFFLYESPRWLFIARREDQGISNLVALRGLLASHPRVAQEIEDIKCQIAKEEEKFGRNPGVLVLMKDAFLVPTNLRRVQQCVISYALAQLSGANSVTSYLVPILAMVGVSGGTSRSLFLSGMYSMAKFFFTLIASFFFIDALGRRRSLFTGISIQMISDLYLGVFIKFRQEGPVAPGSSEAAIAAVFIHGFGYAVGLLVLPYVFGAELWPNHLRSFGSAFSQFFHWLFFFGVNKGMPSLLKQTNNWGAFIFFSGWCFLSLVYVYCVVPETSQQSLEQLDELFKGPWWNVNRRARQMKKEAQEAVLDAQDSESDCNVSKDKSQTVSQKV
ncbi:MFS quinate transporter [Colletotrichum karsti]|uniref:MFS quinate transporter n=1 Tax=Colletotrichum karsti TaxID=1095194 RepID=A0A9P6I8H9_9PEZI|nr:MFS quinate transporter [Colletotrichum karsti]KAF9878832.1 MFS quinate transporter [Colletotrichum karsti]